MTYLPIFILHAQECFDAWEIWRHKFRLTSSNRRRRRQRRLTRRRRWLVETSASTRLGRVKTKCSVLCSIKGEEQTDLSKTLNWWWPKKWSFLSVKIEKKVFKNTIGGVPPSENWTDFRRSSHFRRGFSKSHQKLILRQILTQPQLWSSFSKLEDRDKKIFNFFFLRKKVRMKPTGPRV